MPRNEYPTWINQLDVNVCNYAEAAFVLFEQHITNELNALEKVHGVCLEEELKLALQAAQEFLNSLQIVTLWINENNWDQVSVWFTTYSRQKFYFNEVLPFFLSASKQN